MVSLRHALPLDMDHSFTRRSYPALRQLRRPESLEPGGGRHDEDLHLRRQREITHDHVYPRSRSIPRDLPRQSVSLGFLE